MADAQYKIKIDIVGSGSTKGAAEVNRAIDSIAKHGQSASAANDNLRSTFDNITTSMGNTSSGASKLNSTLGAVKSQASAASSGLKQVGSAAHEADGGILSMVEHIGKATLAIAGLTFLVEGIHALAEAFVEASNEATEVASRLAVVTASSAGLAAAQAQVVAISTQTRAALTDTAELYQKIGIQADHLKLSTAGVGTATKTFAETLKISGATQQQAAGSMRQLGEAFDIGKLSGVHYQAMMADNIVFMRLLAQSMGVPMGKLKELSTQGKVTADDLKKALTDPKLTDDVQKRFDRMPVSFADARTAIHNTLVQLAGDFGKGAGLNDALKSLYDQISAFGQSAAPAFEKIGVAARAAFSAIAPAATAAWTAIKPVFSFVLDNAPALISLLKVAAEGWLAYKAATLAVSAVNLASTLATEVQFLGLVAKEVLTGASAFSELGKALKAATGAQALFNLVAEANPNVLVATAIITVIGLLYEFRDAISLGGGTMATLGDLFRAIWADIKSGVTTAITAVENVFSGLWNGIKTGVAAVGNFLGDAFSIPLNAISKLFSDTFGDLDFSIAGILVGAARVADGLVGLFRGSVAAIGVLFNELPDLIYNSLSPTLQGIVTDAKNLVVGIGNGIAAVFNAVVGFGQSLIGTITSVFNSIAGFIEKWANKAIDAINGIIGAADKLGAGIEKVATVKIGQIAPPKAETAGWTKLGNDVGAAFKSGFGHEAENGVKGLLKQASQIGAARRAAGAHTAPGTPAATQGVPEGDDAGDGKRDKAAERRAKQEAEFWAALKGEVETSKLLPLAAEDYKKQLELQKILGRDLNKGEIDRIGSLQQQARTAKVLTDALDTHNKTQLSLAEQQTLQQDKLNGMTDEQLAVEKSVLDFRVSAQERGVDLQDAAYKAAENQLRIDQQAVQAVEARNKAITDGIAAAEQYSKSYQTYSANKDLTKQRSEFEAAYNGGNNNLGLTKQVHDEVVSGFDKASKDISTKWADDMSDRINQIGEEFGGKIGKAIQGIANLLKSVTNASKGDFSGLGKIGSLLDTFGKKSDGTLNSFGQGAEDGAKNMLDEAFKSDTWTKPFKSMSDNFKGLKDSFTGANGSFAKGMGKALGQAGVGVQIGDQVNKIIGPLGKALGVQTSKLGSEVGGALGSVFGPVGSVLGAIGGGIIGGLFKSAPKGATNVSLDSYGNIVKGDSSGNNAKAITASQGAATSVGSGLNNIAQTLGAMLTGDPQVSIGTYKGKWRVQTNGTDKLKGGGSGADTLTDFGKDGEADAIQFAIIAALKQGVLTGLSEFSEQVLKNATDIDAATALAAKYENVLKSLKTWQDPVGAAVDAITKPLDQLITSMKANGATAADIANVETERTHELQEALKSNVSGFTDLLDTLNGASGKTSLALLNEEMAQFKSYQSDLAAGKTVDEDAFTALANKIASNAGDVYDPNSSAYQDIISALKDATTSAIGNYTSQWNADTANDGTTAAINSQTDSITAAQGVTNDYLSQILSALQSGGTPTTSKSTGGNVNGKTAIAY
ncbi:tape measure protein [Sphingomonas oryzagri]